MRKNLLRTIEALRNIPCTLIIVGILKQEHIEQLKKNHIQYKNYLVFPFKISLDYTKNVTSSVFLLYMKVLECL